MLPFVSLAIVFYFIFKFLATESQVINDELVLTMGRYDVASRVAVAVQIPYFYMTKLFVPVGLSTEYQIEFSRSVFSPVVILALLGLFLSLSLAYYFRRKFPQALFALLWFVTCLLPVLNFFLTNPVVADRYVYLSSYAYAYILATLFFEVGKRIDHPRLLMVLLPVLGVYALMAFERNDVWRTHLSVMEDMTKPFSNQVKGFNALGQYYFNVGQFPKALTNFQKAKEISPAFSELEFHKAKLAFQQNRPLEALELLNAASRLNEKETHEAWSLRGQIHESQGDLIQAARRYRESVESVHFTKSSREQAVSRLQRVMTKLEPSLEATRKDILDHPGDLNLKANFAVMLQSVGLNKEALALYEELLRLGGPKWEVYANLGMLYMKEGQIEQSIHNYKMSLSLNNTSARIHDELGIVYFQAGKFEAALNHFQTGVELDPKSANALLNLARLHFQLGNDQLARQTFNRLLLEFPEYEALAREYLLKLSRS